MTDIGVPFDTLVTDIGVCFSTKFGYSEEMKHKLSKISSATIGRMISLNKAQRWVKEAVDDVKEKLPFQMKGLDSDNGSELKNTQLLGWCQENHVEL